MEDPLFNLLNTLEVSLTILLEKVNNDPWSLLIFQTLLWSFRRWAIHYLMSSEMTGDLQDYVWDTHIDLVREFAPDGLKEFGVIWLNPMNVGERVDILEELNAYFLCIVDGLDRVLKSDSDDEQNALAIFLDETITNIITKWLNEREQYRIYPKSSDSPDTFENGSIFTIMQMILEKHVRQQIPEPAIAQVLEGGLEQQAVPEATSEATSEATPEATPEANPPRPEATPEENPPRPEARPPTPEAKPPTPEEKPTIASALRRRRTMRAKDRRLHSEKGTRKHKTLH